MKISIPAVRPGFEWAIPVNAADNECIWSLDGTTRRESWTPIEVRILSIDDAGARRATADMPWLGEGEFVLRERAAAALGPLLERHGELLPLDCADAKLWLFNTLTIVDALDEDGCELVRFDDGGILDVERYAFRSEILTGKAVFKVPQLLRGPIFLSDEFAAALAGLVGPELVEVWQS